MRTELTGDVTRHVVHFVLLRGIGTPFVDGTVPEEAVLDALAGECGRS